MNTILSPIITEKTLALAASRHYTLAVAPDASKNQIKVTLLSLFGVHVKKVNISRRHVPARRTGTKRLLGSDSSRKIAIVQLAKDETLDLFEVKG